MSTTENEAITHIVFDLDGLLLDTESLYTASSQKILQRYGKEFSWDVKSRIMGRAPLDAAQKLVDLMEIPLTAEEFHGELYSNLMEVFPSAKLMPGSMEIVRHLHSLGLPMAIATGSAQHTYQLKVSKYPELTSWFSHATCSDDKELKRGKPAPDVYLLAMSRFKSPPKSSAQVLVFEDAPNGVESAKAAGMRVVMVPDRRTDREKCRRADQVVESLEHVDLTQFGLPPLPAIVSGVETSDK